MALSVPLTSFVRFTSFLPLASLEQPPQCRRLVPKAIDVHPPLSSKQCDVLVRQIEVSGIAQQRDFA